MTLIAESDRAAVRDLLADQLETDVELLFFTAVRSGPATSSGMERSTCDETSELLGDLAGLSDRLRLTTHDVVDNPQTARSYNVSAMPTVVIRRVEAEARAASSLANRTGMQLQARAPASTGANVRFVGQPGGYEFTTLLSDIVDLSKGTTDLTPAVLAAVRSIERPVYIQVFVTPACPSCPRAARLAHQLAMTNPLIVADVIEANEFPGLSERYQVRSVPKTVINNRVQFVGTISEARLLEALARAMSDDA